MNKTTSIDSFSNVICDAKWRFERPGIPNFTGTPIFEEKKGSYHLVVFESFFQITQGWSQRQYSTYYRVTSVGEFEGAEVILSIL